MTQQSAARRMHRQRVTISYAAHESSTKTENSERTIELDAPVVAALRSHRKRRAAERLAWPGVTNEAGWVFTAEDGPPTHRQTIANGLRTAATAAGVPWVGVHGLRHTCAVLLMVAGVPLKVVSERLGHSSTTFTADLYQHVIPGMQRSASAEISRPMGMG